MPHVVILLVLHAVMTYCVYLKLASLARSIAAPATSPKKVASDALANFRLKQARKELDTVTEQIEAAERAAAAKLPAPDLDEKIDAFFLTQSARRSKAVK